VTDSQRADLAPLEPVHAAAVTAYGEARNQSVLGLVAVICVIRNRVRAGRWTSWTAAALAPFQFSCWNTDDPNCARLVDISERLITGRPMPIVSDAIVLKACLWIAEEVFVGHVDDVTGGAVSYFNPKVVAAPKWAAPPARRTTQIGDHVFYAGVAL
jgi:N-acetylmuramoyl-L-alanine amidase